VDASQNVTLAGTLTATGVTTVPAGTVSAPAITTTGDTNTGIYFPAADTIAFSEGGVESMRIDSSGNVGIGTASPDFQFQVEKTAASTFVSVVSGTSSTAGILFGDTDSATIGRIEYANDINSMQFHTNGAERARITSAGDLLIGATTAPTFAGIGMAGGIGFATSNTYYYTIQSNTTDFYIGTSNLSRYAALGPLNTFTAWSFGSDRRIKYDIEDVKYGLQTVLDLKPRQYKFKDGDDFSIGFVAQELQEVVPEAVTGEEIEFDDADTPQERAKKTMGVSKDTLIPVLVKAIQEQQALITTLTDRITALETPTGTQA
jgi:hypothetical protein